MKRALGAGLVVTLALGVASSANAALYWTPWVSEEGGSPASFCSEWNEAAVGFGCRGGFCDDVRLLCETLPFGATLDSATSHWTSFFSEENDGIEQVSHHTWYPFFDEHYRVCHATSSGGLVQGVRCSGSNCDNVSLECAQPVKFINGVKTNVSIVSCGWTTPQSEEQGSIDFGFNRVVVGAKCTGSFCDNLSFYVCSLQNPG